MISGRHRERKFLLRWLQKRNDYLVTRDGLHAIVDLGTRPISAGRHPAFCGKGVQIGEQQAGLPRENRPPARTSPRSLVIEAGSTSRPASLGEGSLKRSSPRIEEAAPACS